MGLLLTLITGCGESKKDTVLLFQSGARGVGPLQSSHDKFSTELKQVMDGQAPNAETMKTLIQDFEKSIQDRRERLKKMEPVPAGQNTKLLLESCQKHLELQEKTWLPEMKQIQELMEKKEDGVLLKLSIRTAMGKCVADEKTAMKDLSDKFDAFEKEFAADLKK
ncbi:MAG: hypothetical protein K8T89_16305 [Planctomycetes bacterium]|nr:hypothetical protein [Planctomycetota bacterium]